MPPGRQLERTALSWQRTALSASVAALLLLREGLREGLTHGTALTAVAGLCLVAFAVLAAVAGRAGGAAGGAGRAGGVARRAGGVAGRTGGVAGAAGRRRLVLAGAVLVGTAGALLALQLAISA